jgi:hypothetical protein
MIFVLYSNSTKIRDEIKAIREYSIVCSLGSPIQQPISVAIRTKNTRARTTLLFVCMSTPVQAALKNNGYILAVQAKQYQHNSAENPEKYSSLRCRINPHPIVIFLIPILPFVSR